MSTSSELYNLIHSLSKAEKRRLRLYAAASDSPPTFMRLFDILAKQPTYNEQAMRLAMQKYSRSNQIHVLKNYLYEVILNSLDDACVEHSPGTQIRNLLNRGEILFHKGLLKQAWKLASKAQVIAERHELFAELLSVIEIKRGIVFPLYGAKAETEAKVLVALKDRTLQQVNNVSAYADLLERTIALLKDARTKRNAGLVKKILAVRDSELASNENHAISKTARIDYLMTHVNLDFYHRRYSDAVGHLCSIRDLIYGDAALIESRAITLVVTLSNLLYVSSLIHDWKEFQHTIEFLEDMTKRAELMVNTRLSAELEVARLNAKVAQLMSQGSYSECLALESDVVLTESRLMRITGSDAFLTIWLSYIVVCFRCAEYTRCLKWIRHVEEHFKGHKPDVLVTIRLIELMTHYQIGELTYLPFAVRSVERMLKQYGLLDASHKNVLTFLRRAPKHSNRSRFERDVVKLRSALEESGNEMLIRSLEQHLSFDTWAAELLRSTEP
jgi:hypothetical protein